MTTITVYHLGEEFEISKIVADKLNLKNGQIIETDDEFFKMTEEQFNYSLLIISSEFTNKSN